VLALGVIGNPVRASAGKAGEGAAALPGQKGSNTNPAEQQEQGAVSGRNRETDSARRPRESEGLLGGSAKQDPASGGSARRPKRRHQTDEVKIIGWIHTDGRVTSLAVERGSGKGSVDRAAMSAISGSAPYDPFPYGIAVDEVKVRFTFGSGGAAPGAAPPAVVH